MVQKEIMGTILCVHQGTEKYGSDKSFVAAVAAIAQASQFQSTILLPGTGPILDLIDEYGLAAPLTRHLWVLRKASFLHDISLGLPGNLMAIVSAMRDLHRFDTIYVNTSVIMDFLLASIFTRRAIVVHVREIPTGINKKVIRGLLAMANARVIFNSMSTQTAFALPERVAQSVVYNGFDASPPARKLVGSMLNVLCIGRLNAWKGQEVLIDACGLLPAEARNKIRVRIVGGVYKDQTHYRAALVERIAQHDLQGMVTLHDFTDNPIEDYYHANVVVVPSTLPEPFGRVAIEGMAYGCAVIAANHGGLTEIVVEGETGWLVTPGSPYALRGAILQALATPSETRQRGERGRIRFEQVFTQAASDKALIAALRSLAKIT